MEKVRWYMYMIEAIHKSLHKCFNKLIILGAGGHGRVVADIALKSKRWKQIAFLDDDNSLQPFLGIKVIGDINSIERYLEEYEVFVAMGNNMIRQKVSLDLEEKGARIPIIVHPDSVIGSNVTIGTGSVVMAGVVINCNSSIGKGCIINTCASVDHDNIIGDYVHLSPGVHTAGTVNIGNASWIGIGAILRNDIRIVNNCVIGAGAVVVKDIMEIGTYVGNPVRRL